MFDRTPLPSLFPPLLFPLSDPNVLNECTFETEDEKETLVTNIKHRLTPHPVKIRAGTSVESPSNLVLHGLTYTHTHTHPSCVDCLTDVEVSCYGYEGIDAVKAALKAGLAHSTEEMPLKVVCANG